MSRVLGLLMLLTIVLFLFVAPLGIIIKTHSVFYQSWIVLSGHTSQFFSQKELITSQAVIFNNLFSDLPNFLMLSKREIFHLHDIAYLIIGLYVFLAAIIAACIVLLSSICVKTYFITKTFRKHLTHTSIGVLLSILIGTLTFFDTLFISLHTHIFNNDFWLLPEDALLINIYPPVFFKHMLFYALTFAILLYIIIIAISYSLEQKYETKH